MHVACLTILSFLAFFFKYLYRRSYSAPRYSIICISSYCCYSVQTCFIPKDFISLFGPGVILGACILLAGFCYNSKTFAWPLVSTVQFSRQHAWPIFLVLNQKKKSLKCILQARDGVPIGFLDIRI